MGGSAGVAAKVQNPAAGAGIATAELAPYVNAIQAATGSVVTAIDRSGVTVQLFGELSLRVTYAVVKQRGANDESNHSICEAAVATRDGTQSLAIFLNAVGKTGDAAKQMFGDRLERSCIAELLLSAVNRFLVVIHTVWNRANARALTRPMRSWCGQQCARLPQMLRLPVRRGTILARGCHITGDRSARACTLHCDTEYRWLPAFPVHAPACHQCSPTSAQHAGLRSSMTRSPASAAVQR